jgi:hypothetical protein
MATSAAEICNKALARLGITKFISDLDDATDANAAACKVFYADLLDAALAAFPWTFATLRRTLNQIAGEAARDGWKYVYALPAGCLAPRRIWPANSGIKYASQTKDRIPYVIEKSSTDDTQVLLCDEPSPVLHYTARIVDPMKLPPMFVDAFAWMLASELALPLTSKEKKLEMCAKIYLVKINEAQAHDLSVNEQDTGWPEGEGVQAR